MPQTAAALIATVIVPTYNESENLPVLVERICVACPGAEIVVVDDASKDGTAAVARDLSKKFPVRIVERFDERGLSTAVLRGMDEARTDVCVVMDADLSHPPEVIPKLVQAVQDGADVAVGSRYVPGGDIDHWPWFRTFASRAGTFLARPLTPVRDPMAGYFCLKKSLLAGITLKPRGFKILLEILARTRAKKTVEVPIHFEDRIQGASKFSSKERYEFLRQVGQLYLDLNIWPWRVAKFLCTGALGMVVNLAVLNLAIRVFHFGRDAAVVAAWTVAMSSNYVLNRIWTFRAQQLPIATSYLKYGLGCLGGLVIQDGVMRLLPLMNYNLSASLGIVAGTVFNYLASQLWAFSRK